MTTSVHEQLQKHRQANFRVKVVEDKFNFPGKLLAVTLDGENWHSLPCQDKELLYIRNCIDQYLMKGSHHEMPLMSSKLISELAAANRLLEESEQPFYKALEIIKKVLKDNQL